MIQKILTLIASVAGVIAVASLTVWQASLYRALSKNTEEIRVKQKEIDSVVSDVAVHAAGHLVNETQRVKQVEKGQAPLLRDLEHLKEERELIKDKLLFAKK